MIRGTNPPNDSSSSLSNSNERNGARKGQPTLPSIPLGWGGMPPNWILYFPWYHTMSPMTIITNNSDKGRKLLNYP
jgi:hypothetical protein